jgi:hypothetical protein
LTDNEERDGKMPQLIEEFTYYADLQVDQVGNGPYGTRTIFNVTGGEFDGERLKGTIVGAGADWMLIGPDGYGRLDVRATFRTADGAFIYLQYFGVIELTQAILDLAGGGERATEFGDQYFFTSPRFETGDPRYAWLNETMFLSQGRLVPGPRVEYHVFRVTN